MGSTVADAEVSAISLYTLFIGVCQDTPVWLMKLGNRLYGNEIRILCEGSDVTLEEAPATVTALYAVL